MIPGAAHEAVWALVPVKPVKRAKRRLSSVLSAEKRARLQLAMLEDTLSALSQARHVGGIAVITRDVTVRAITLRRQGTVIDEPAGCGGLNDAVTVGVDQLREMGASHVAVLPSDLPLADPEEIDLAVAAAMAGGATVAVPDRWETGTNALVFPIDSALPFSFGPDSFRIHLATGGERPARAMRLASLELDIDLPEDLQRLKALGEAISGRSTRDFVTSVADLSAAHRSGSSRHEQRAEHDLG